MARPDRSRALARPANGRLAARGNGSFPTSRQRQLLTTEQPAVCQRG